MLLQYLNRVHFDAPMSPLELEIYHQMRNVIGIDPTFYEYIFQVDADTVGNFPLPSYLPPFLPRSLPSFPPVPLVPIYSLSRNESHVGELTEQTVTPDSLNRLISCAADDSRIIGVCGETKLENERESLTTMIQVSCLETR